MSDTKRLHKINEDDIMSPHGFKGCCRNCGRSVQGHSMIELRICAAALRTLPQREQLEREISR